MGHGFPRVRFHQEVVEEVDYEEPSTERGTERDVVRVDAPVNV